MKTKQVVSKDMMIGEVVNKYPESASVMLSYGLHCVGCAVNPYESIEAGAMGHGMSEETVDNLIKDINKILEGNEESSKKIITITKNAADKFKDFAKEENKEISFVRLSCHGGGCSGFQYALDFVDEKTTNDELFEEFGVKILVDKTLVNKIKGTKIDYVENENGSGFKIEQVGAGGCGTGCGCN